MLFGLWRFRSHIQLFPGPKYLSTTFEVSATNDTNVPVFRAASNLVPVIEGKLINLAVPVFKTKKDSEWKFQNSCITGKWLMQILSGSGGSFRNPQDDSKRKERPST